MSNQLFPPEILEYSAESYYAKLSIHSRIIYVSVLFFIIAAIALLPFIKVDVTTQSRGIIRSPIENTIIQSSVYSEIIRFSMQENKSVLAGDTLIILNTEQLDEKINLEIQKENDNTVFIQDIELLLNGKKGIVSPKYKTEYNRYISIIEENNIRINYLKKEFETAQVLYDKGVISNSEYLQEKNTWEAVNSSRSSIIEEYRFSWQNEKTRLELENQNILSTIKQLDKEKNNYIITAPISGSLIQVAGFQAGNFIAPNQPLAYISCSDSLLVECYLSPLDIGYIEVEQRVSCQIDAFDYRQWGLIDGKVAEILNDVVIMENTPVFRIRCSLDTNCLQLKNGYKGYLKKGMTLTCRFYLTRRSLWQLLFDKIDNWINPKMSQNEKNSQNKTT